MGRLKSCMYCGRIHDVNITCKAKEKRSITNKSKAGDLRNTYKWRKKRTSIKERDNHMCQICKSEFLKDNKMFKVKDVQVHHITPYKENESLFYDDDNLITLCNHHHELAEAGHIDKDKLRRIAIDNN